MLWVIVIAVIAVLGLVMVIGYAVWLIHKASDVLAELSMLGRRGNELFDLLGRIQPPAYTQMDPSRIVRGDED